MSKENNACILAETGITKDNAAEVDTVSLIWANYAIAEALAREIKDRDGSGSVDVREGLGEAQRTIARMLCDRLNTAPQEDQLAAAAAPPEPEQPAPGPRRRLDS